MEKVSIIMPAYNSAKFIAEAIESILSQTYTNWELLITDDGSTDNTYMLLQDYAKRDPRILVFLTEHNSGPADARNISISHASGRYIAFLDSDDRWTNDKLEKQISFMTQKDCALCCAPYIICDENNQFVGINFPPKRITFSMLKRDNKVGCLTAIYDTKKLGQKFLMPCLRKRQDWGMFLQIMKKCNVCYPFLDKPLAYYRTRKGSVSSKKSALIKYNVAVYHDILGYSKIKAYLYFFLLFMPTYGLKVWKRKRDSKAYARSLKKGNQQASFLK